MALTTRCPQCHAVFRVVADQLKLRGGLVRCGQCSTVFDAIGALSYLEDTQLKQALATRTAPAPRAVSSGAAPTPRAAAPGPALPSPPPAAVPATPRVPHAEPAAWASLRRAAADSPLLAGASSAQHDAAAEGPATDDEPHDADLLVAQTATAPELAVDPAPTAGPPAVAEFEAEDEPRTEDEAEFELAPQPELEVEPVLDAEPALRAEPVLEAESELDAEPELDAGSAIPAATESAGASLASAGAEVAALARPEALAQLEPTPVLPADGESEAVPEPASALAAEVVPASTSDSASDLATDAAVEVAAERAADLDRAVGPGDLPEPEITWSRAEPSASANREDEPVAQEPSEAETEPALVEQSTDPADLALETTGPEHDTAAAITHDGGTPDTVAPDTIAPDTVAPETIAPDTVARGPAASEPFSPDNAAPEAVLPVAGFLDAAAQSRARRRAWLWGLAAALAAVALAWQLAVALRAEILMRWPQAHPALVRLCEPLGCRVEWPTQPALLAVLASDLQAVPGTAALELDVTLRNRAPYPQALPALELTLTDTRGQVISRRVFMPAEYGAPAQASLAPGADLAARVLFEVKDGVPAGFLVYPFYP